MSNVTLFCRMADLVGCYKERKCADASLYNIEYVNRFRPESVPDAPPVFEEQDFDDYSLCDEDDLLRNRTVVRNVSPVPEEQDRRLDDPVPESTESVRVASEEQPIQRAEPFDLKKLIREKVFVFGVVSASDAELFKFLDDMAGAMPMRPDVPCCVFGSHTANGLIYAVFNKLTQQCVSRRLKDEICRSLVEQSRDLCVKIAWWSVTEQMLVDQCVAQGAGVEIVHWSDPRLVEARFVLRDQAIDDSILRRWKDKDWSPIEVHEFCKGFPAVAHNDANWCDDCGGVDMCGHLLLQIFPQGMIDVGAFISRAIYGVYELLNLRENPSVISITSPHLRYALARTLCAFSEDKRLVFWKAAAEVMAYQLYPNVIVPQSLLSDGIETLRSVMAVLYDIFSFVPRTIGTQLCELMNWCVSSIGAMVRDGVLGLVDSVYARCVDNVAKTLSGVLEKMKPVIMSIIKTIVRIGLDYTPLSIMLELAWDSSLYDCSMAAFKSLMGTWQAQGSEDLGCVFAAMGLALFVALGRTIPSYRQMSELLTAMVVAAGAFHRSQLWDGFKALKAWLDGDETVAKMEVYKTRYPGTVAMINEHIQVVQTNTFGHCASSSRARLGFYYASYLKEKLKFGKDRELLDLCRPAVQFITSTGISPVEKLRLRPPCVFFYGDSGLGKSRLVGKLSSLIARRHKELYEVNGDFSLSNAVYHVNVADDYASGYDNQDIWTFDEWLQDKDSEQNPSKSVSLLFALVSTIPTKLNMAAVDDKGKAVNANLVLGATNIALNDNTLKNFVKSIHEPDAICTRISHRVQVKLKKPYCLMKGKLFKQVGELVVPIDDDVPEAEMYEFKVTTTGDVVLPGDLESGLWSWKHLVCEIDRQYMKCKEYVPSDGELDLSIFDDDSKGKDEDDEIVEHEAQGWRDWLPSFSWRNDLPKYYTVEANADEYELTGVRSDIDFEEILDKTVEGAERLFKEWPTGEVIAYECHDDQKTEKRGLFVWVVKKPSYDPKTIGLCLLMVSVGIAAAVPLARKLRGTCSDAKNLASVIVDGVTYWWHGDKSCYSAEGTLVDINGVKYMRVSTKSGYKFYPQGAGGDMLKLLDNQRTIQQVPVIYDSVFNISCSGETIGNAFALHDSALVLPLHVGRALVKSGGLLTNGKVAVELRATDGKVETGYRLLEVATDCAVLELLAYKLNGIRNNLTKLSRKTPQSGLCRQVFRDSDGTIRTTDATFKGSDVDVEYDYRNEHYRNPRKTVRSTDALGIAGMCGAVYINLNQRNQDPIVGGVVIGYHLAANSTQGSRIFGVFDDVTFRLSNLVSSCYPPLENVPNGFGQVLNMESGECTGSSPINLDGRLGETVVPEVLGAKAYKVSLLRSLEKDGKTIDPLLNSLTDLSKYVSREIDYPQKLWKVVDFLCDKFSKEAILVNPDWVGAFSGAGVLPAISRTTAVGYPLNQLGPTKDVMCLNAKELQELGLSDCAVPSIETLAMLDELVDRIKAGYCFESVCNASLKEEARLSSKVEEGSTRMFSGAPGHEFLLQRRFFMTLAATTLHKNMAVNSALGLEPNDGARVHEWLLQGLKNPKIFCGDYKGKDRSFTPMYFTFVNRIIRSICLGYPVGDDIVDEDDYIRSVLLKRLAFNRLLVGSEIIEPKGQHPSGSFLTALINWVGDNIDFYYGLSEMCGCQPAEVDGLAKMLFLGDDSIVACQEGEKYDLKKFVDAVADCGFTITGSDKDKGVEWLDPYDGKTPRSNYEFLSRHFTQSYSVLSIHRLSKMMRFCEERRVLEVWPQSIISLREEVAAYVRTGQYDWCKMILPQLEFFGFRDVIEFVGVSNDELVQRLLNKLADDVSAVKVTVPAYNRKKFTAQGPGDGEPSEERDLGDAEFVSAVGSSEMVTDHIEDDYIQDHMDAVNFAPANVFERPVITVTGMTGTTSDVMIANFMAASSYFLNNFNAQAKLANTIFMRCKFCAKIVVASGPFVAGKLLVAFRPTAIAAGSLIQASADPCTEVDLSSARSAVIKFETLLPGNWMLVEKFTDPVDTSTYNDGFDYGNISVWTMTPLSDSVPYTIYTWLEDVQLRGTGFTNFTLTAQGKDKKEKKEGKKVEKASVSKDYQGELELLKWKWKVENTPDWLNKAAASVETVGGCIETIEESILGPAGDFIEKTGEAAGEAGGAAMLFGLSVPSPPVHIEGCQFAPNYASAQMMCNIPSVRLAVVQTQRTVTPRTLFGNRGDEMNIKEFVSRMAVLSRFFWSGSDTNGTTLATWNVMPGTLAEAPVGGHGAFAVEPHPLGFMAGVFRMWRGAIKYRLSVAKTAFHTGTLEVIWQMGLNTASPSTPSQDALSQRFIWDVTQNSSIEFEVPYVARTPFTQVYFTPFQLPLQVSDLTTGRIYVNVINPLTNSAGTVPSAITCVLYIAGGHDIEFAMPGRQHQLRDPVTGGFVAQGGPFGDDETEDGLSTVVLRTLRNVPRTSAWAHLSTMGERVLSARLLIKRFGTPRLLASTIDFSQLLLSNFFMAYLQRAYAFWVGSWRVNIMISQYDYNASLSPLFWTLSWNNTYDVNFDGAAHMFISPTSNVTILEVPWYSNLAFKYVGEFPLCKLEGANPPNSYAEYAAGDDFSYGFQIGCGLTNYTTTRPDPLY